MSGSDDEDRWSWSGARRGALITVVCTGLGAGLGALITHEPPPPTGAASARPRARPAGSSELAVVAPLVVGARLGDFEVREIRAVEAGTIAVVCERGDVRVRLHVARAGGSASAPATGGPYDVYYAVERGASNEDAAKLAQALAEIVAKNPGALPPDLGPFVPVAREVTL